MKYPFKQKKHLKNIDITVGEHGFVVWQNFTMNGLPDRRVLIDGSLIKINGAVGGSSHPDFPLITKIKDKRIKIKKNPKW